MSELVIQPQCETCVFRSEASTEEGRAELALKGLEMAITREETMQGCRHPWRVMNGIYGENPSEDQKQVMARLVSLRGKITADYGLPNVEPVE